MSRLVRNAAALHDGAVADTPVAPHRYTWNGGEHESQYDQRTDDLDAWRAALAYRIGDAVYVERNGRPVLARVLHVFLDYTRHEDRIAKYRVQLATKAGQWSRSWVYVWPGHIQRGYALAGLAPDVPEHQRRA